MNKTIGDIKATALYGLHMGSYMNNKGRKEQVAVIKAYSVKEDNGPFPTEQAAHIENDVVTEYAEEDAYIGDVIRNYGHEYGATTKRPRRTGWFDAVLVKSSKRALGPDYLCINHLDTLGEIGNKLGFVRMCVRYVYQGKMIDHYPDDIELTGEIPEPMYYDFIGGWSIPSTVREYNQLPYKAKEFIRAIEIETGIPVKFIGVGPDNEDLIVREDI